MNPAIQGELIARVERVKNDASLLLEALYYHYPELRDSGDPATKGCDHTTIQTHFGLTNIPQEYKDKFTWQSHDLLDGDSEAVNGDREAVKGLREWFRGKTSPESNSGSFAPSPTGPAVESHLRELLLANTKLSPLNRRDYMKTLSTIVANMPPAAHKLILDNVKEIKAFDTLPELRAYIASQEGKKGRRINGAYNARRGQLVLNGGSVGPEAYDWDERVEKRHRIYAHELSHVIDSGHRISKSSQWRQAYDEEIRHSTDTALAGARYEMYRDEEPETAYAEGFAEIGRFMYEGSDAQIAANIKYCKTYLPKCYAVFEEHRLIMKNQNTKSQDEELAQEQEGVRSPYFSKLAPENFSGSSESDEQDGWILDDFIDKEGRSTLTTSSLCPIDFEPGDDVSKP